MRILSVAALIALVGFACTKPAPPQPGATGPAPGPAPQADPADDAASFYASGFRFCDAVLLAARWDQPDPWEAKVTISRRIDNGRMDTVQRELKAARGQARDGTGRRCTLGEAGFSYADAEALAAHWQIGVSEAKSSLLLKVHWGDYDMAEDAVARAKAEARPDGRTWDPDEGALRAFFDSEAVDYCHAKMVAAAWGSSLSQAKVALGHKVLGGQTQILEATLDHARQHAQKDPAARCSFVDTSFTYDDAVKLSQMWQTPVSEAKVAIARKYLYGWEQDVREMLHHGG